MDILACRTAATPSALVAHSLVARSGSATGSRKALLEESGHGV